MTASSQRDPAKLNRSEWTSEDSKRELQRIAAAGGAAADPVVSKAREFLSENMWFFLEHIGDRCARYQDAMLHVKARNPNHTMTPEQLLNSLSIPDEEKYLSIRLRRVIVDDEEGDEDGTDGEAAESSPKNPKDDEPKQEDDRGEDGAAKTGEEAEDDADDDDDEDEDDDDFYDPLDDIAVKFPTNVELLDEMKKLKTAGTELGTELEGISDWIALSIPDIMVDDNDSVDVMTSIQEATNAHLAAVRSTVSFHRDYLDERADLEVDILKFPHSCSLRRQMVLNDLESWGEVERGWQTLTRCALIIHMLLSKNMKKLLNPRSAHRSVGIYQ